jgi:hypothetical protein
MVVEDGRERRSSVSVEAASLVCRRCIHPIYAQSRKGGAERTRSECRTERVAKGGRAETRTRSGTHGRGAVGAHVDVPR